MKLAELTVIPSKEEVYVFGIYTALKSPLLSIIHFLMIPSKEIVASVFLKSIYSKVDKAEIHSISSSNRLLS